jgi:hypothetical protein
MINNRKILAFIFWIVLILNGCVVYYPHTPDIPSVSKEKEVIVDGGISIIPSINATINYGINDKYAVYGFGNLDGDNRYSLESAVGYYNTNDNKKTKSIYFGIGHGIADYSSDIDFDCKGNYQIYYLQPNYIIRSKKYNFYEIGLGLKTGILNSHLWTSEYFFITDSYSRYYENDFSYLFEPMVSIKLGGEKFKINFKYSWCYLKTMTSSNNIDYWPIGNIGLSLNYCFGK